MTIYHNPKCSKSRGALQILQERGIEPTVILYMESPPSPETLRDITKKLDITPEELVRKNEDLYKEKYAGKNISSEEWLLILSEHPRLMERPIIINGEKAIIARPAEKVLEVLE
jgi:arsenate reductase (glutaredoxin)